MWLPCFLSAGFYRCYFPLLFDFRSKYFKSCCSTFLGAGFATLGNSALLNWISFGVSFDFSMLMFSNSMLFISGGTKVPPQNSRIAFISSAICCMCLQQQGSIGFELFCPAIYPAKARQNATERMM